MSRERLLRMYSRWIARPSDFQASDAQPTPPEILFESAALLRGMADESPAPPVERRRVMASLLNIRAQPSRQARIVGQLQGGALISVRTDNVVETDGLRYAQLEGEPHQWIALAFTTPI